MVKELSRYLISNYHIVTPTQNYHVDSHTRGEI